MNCFVKDRKTFVTLVGCPVADFDITPNSIYDEVSTLIVMREKEQKFSEGDIVIAGSYIGIIKETTLEELTAELKCEHIVKILDRDLIYSTDPSSPETYLKAQIDVNYTNQPDALYAVPYLDVSALTTTASTMKPDVENGLWNIKSYISKCRRVLGIFTDFTYDRTSLKVTIHRETRPVKKIDLSDPSIRVQEESYSKTSVGKITTWNEDYDEAIDWYLLEDGTVTRDYTTVGRVEGEWQTMTVGGDDDDDIELSVRDEFAKNTFSHKILFDVPDERARFSFYDPLQISGKKRLYYSYVAAVRKTKGSSRTEYQCGELRTTMTDKLQEDL